MPSCVDRIEGMFAAMVDFARSVTAPLWLQFETVKPEATAVTICFVWASNCGELRNNATDWLIARDSLSTTEEALAGILRKLEFHTLKNAV
jgi:hypothetical protein